MIIIVINVCNRHQTVLKAIERNFINFMIKKDDNKLNMCNSHNECFIGYGKIRICLIVQWS